MKGMKWLRGDAGIGLVELTVSMSMLAVMVLGLTTVMIVQARQVAHDKILVDLDHYAELVLNDASMSFGGSHSIIRNSNAGGRAKEFLEFNYLGNTNNGRIFETTLSPERERKVVVLHDGVRPGWVDRFPPVELDPRAGNGKRFRVYVKEFVVRSYQDRPHPDLRIAANLTEVRLILQLEDRVQERTVEREYRRVICTPNRYVSILRRQDSEVDS